MNKRTFLKTTSVLAAGAAFPQLISCKEKPKSDPRTNWAGNLTYSTDNLYTPKNISELQDTIKKLKKVRGLGTKHCFNKIADSTENQISSAAFNKIISLDKDKKTVTVEAGIKYGELCKYLDENGFALYNLASLPHISVAGACATATHGSGIKNGCLASSVSGIEFVNGKGEVINLNKEKDGAEFLGAVVNLGALGIVTKMTLDLQPTFKMKQIVYQNMPMLALEKNFEAIMSAGYSVSLFTDWKNKNINEVWIKSKAEDLKEIAPEFYGAKLQTKNLHPIETLDAINCTDQMGVEGPWYERMPHFKMGFTPSSGKELQSEFFIPFEHAYEGLMAIEKLNAEVSPHLFITEVRAIAADELMMSPFYKKTCVAFHFTWKQETEEVTKLLPSIEEALAPFNPRPHWGKIFTLKPAVLQGRIEKLSEFKDLMTKHDPEGKFRNEFIDKNLF
ncbi:FAD linked oxidase domain protein [Emticicia oligotrophica DSM 17448]|uniref:FAD linked oxidase domain protein n=1 Tax=Emticicia oligotrophica (strain DSM 17448 / CIP 109782 / MTCC 6937 / GPTSA100-15) TaxID=929562 RepID=A0ABM5N480_EMTOG|nr:FAD-binding protein [Emticicia oligotrophica]AFK04293.1 FAD linked oxidase domain protein [Emticicia oligotrophica DSM 17448]